MTSDGTNRDAGWLPSRRTDKSGTLFAIAAAVWMSFALLQVVQSFVLARAAGRVWTLTGAIISGFPWWLSWLALTPIIAVLAERYPFTGGRHWESFVKHAVAGVLIALVQVVTVGAIFWFTTGQFNGVATSLPNQIQRFFGNFFLESVVTYAGTAGVFTAIDFARAVRDEAVVRARLEARAAALESSVARARLDALSMQMNPHFLFNTLTAISGLVSQERKTEAREVIQRLGELLRQSLGNGNGPFSTVAREAALLEDYLYIQRLRFSDRLSASVEIDGSARDLLIPAMLLQPLVENAIRHGIEPGAGKGTVHVTVKCAYETVRITIADSGGGFTLGRDGRPAREGIGIANTRERLDHIYGSAASLALGNPTRRRSGGGRCAADPARSDGRGGGALGMAAAPMHALKPLRVVVVDDEPLAREDIGQLLAGRPDVDVVAACANGMEALEAVRRLQPDVLLLDIRMPGLDGFSVVAQLEGRELPYVVFVTAFDRFAIDAFRVRALDYLLKPVQLARLDEALDRARGQLDKRSAKDWANAVHAAAREQVSDSNAPSFLAELMVRVGTRDIVVKVDEIDWIQAETYYARLHIRGRSYLYRERMHVLEARLNPRHFARVHRSAIVNLDRVREIVHDNHGDHVVVLSTGARVKTSHQRWLEFRDIMRQRTRR